MIGTVFANIPRFILLILLQVLVLDHLDVANGYMVPYLYVLFLLMLPIELPAWAQLAIGAITGLVMDCLQQHTRYAHERLCCDDVSRASTCCGSLAPREGYEFGMRPTVPRMGFAWFLTYAGLLVLVHHFWLFFIEIHRFDSFFGTFFRAMLSAVFTLALCLLGTIPHLSTQNAVDDELRVAEIRTHRRRCSSSAAVFLMRLFWIQVVDGKWKAEAANMAERKVTVYPSRGLIYDRNEQLLVANTPVYDLMVVPGRWRPSIPQRSAD